MGKKKSTKKKLTPEEKLLAEQQAAIEAKAAEEKRKELTLQFLKEKLEQEEKNTRVSLRKLNEQWRQILRKAKTEDLQKEIQILSQTFERVLDRKNAVVKSLSREIAEAAQQEDMALQAHLQNVDRLIAFQDNLMAELHKDFDKKLDVMTKEFKDEREKILAKHKTELQNIKDILFSMNLKDEDATKEYLEASNSKRDEIRNKDIEAKEHLKTELEKVINDLWELFQQALENYKHQTADKQKQFEEMREADKDASADIEKTTRQIQRVQAKINSLKARLNLEQREFEERNTSLKQEKEKILLHFQALKGQMNKSRSTARENLCKLTVESRQCIDTLRERKTKAEGLLKLAELCRKLETEEEKVLPFYRDSIPPEEVDAAMKEAKEGIESDEMKKQHEDDSVEHSCQAMDKITEDPVSEFHMMDNFWKRYNKALLDKLAIEREQAKLKDENVKLKSILKSYLDGISVNENVLSNDNTLFVVNGRTNAGHLNAVPVGDARVQHRPVQVHVQNLGLQQQV